MDNFVRSEWSANGLLDHFSVRSLLSAIYRKNVVAVGADESAPIVDEFLRVPVAGCSAVMHHAPTMSATFIGICEFFAVFLLAPLGLFHALILPQTNWFEIARSTN